MTGLVAIGGVCKSWLATLALMAGQGTLLALLAFALTRAGRLRPAWQAAIWLVVAIKLALPWSPALPWSLSDLIASLSDHASASPTIIAPKGAAQGPIQAWPAVGWIALAFVWLTGASIVVARALVAQRRTAHAARRAPLVPGICLASLGIPDEDPGPSSRHPSAEPGPDHPSLPRRVRLVMGDDDIAPHVVGLVRPIIVVPRALLDDPALLRAALLHELAHVRRLDAIGRLVQIGAAAMMWWWPVVRVVQRRLDLAREAACDAWALERGTVPRPAYARLLVRMAALRAAAAPGLATHHALDARVAAVLGPPARARMGISRRIILAAWALVALGGARSAHARGHVEVCHYTTEIAAALLHAYPEADRNGDGRLSREEACELQAELRQRAQTLDAPDPSTPLPEPLCCNCPEPEVYSSSDTVSCEGVE